MATKHLITITDFCVYHHVEDTFIHSLHEAGLVTITEVDKQTFIPESELQKLEKMIRLHNELEINVAGIEAITHLLQRVELLNDRLQQMNNRLVFYEHD
ncbi:MAG: chaperone modulator CbpM [Mucilaginibacter sp.]